ncbi:MAG: NAD(P)/FAD-dependent oxidoreductase [Candidatus Hydrogenedentes bacterium]|nr:NAD(P)/FAD-dependent oxidoreductase [Candidatus Hydrogenedentota bacterium]
MPTTTTTGSLPVASLPRECDAAIIGGGAAGFFAAITCAESNPGLRVALIEKSAQCLAKVRISGGGRCNVTHACFEPTELVRHYPRGAKALRGPYSRFQPRDTMAWFESRGVALKIESDGRVFPVTDQSETIIECLTRAAQQAGVSVHTTTSIRDIRRDSSGSGSGFVATVKDAEPLRCKRLLLATGNGVYGWRWAQELGHTIEEPVPSLFTFTIHDPRLRDLAGVVVDPVCLRLKDANLEQPGPLLITHWGLSGPVVLRLSAWGARILHERGYLMELEVDWAPKRTTEQLRDSISKEKTANARRTIMSHPVEDLPKRLWARLTHAAGIREDERWADLSKSETVRLVDEIHRGTFQITSKGVFKEEFVTCGGVRLDEVNLKTMESRVCPRLHFAGEILDIDGVTGGFNFQSAWTTGYLAGLAMAAGE